MNPSVSDTSSLKLLKWDDCDTYSIVLTGVEAGQITVPQGSGSTVYNPASPTGTSHISGSGSEIWHIAQTIITALRGSVVKYKRCAVLILDDDNVFLWNPKQGHVAAITYLSDAKAFAWSALRELEKARQASKSSP